MRLQGIDPEMLSADKGRNIVTKRKNSLIAGVPPPNHLNCNTGLLESNRSRRFFSPMADTSWLSRRNGVRAMERLGDNPSELRCLAPSDSFDNKSQADRCTLVNKSDRFDAIDQSIAYPRTSTDTETTLALDTTVLHFKSPENFVFDSASKCALDSDTSSTLYQTNGKPGGIDLGNDLKGVLFAFHTAGANHLENEAIRECVPNSKRGERLTVPLHFKRVYDNQFEPTVPWIFGRYAAITQRLNVSQTNNDGDMITSLDDYRSQFGAEMTKTSFDILPVDFTRPSAVSGQSNVCSTQLNGPNLFRWQLDLPRYPLVDENRFIAFNERETAYYVPFMDGPKESDCVLVLGDVGLNNEHMRVQIYNVNLTAREKYSAKKPYNRQSHFIHVGDFDKQIKHGFNRSMDTLNQLRILSSCSVPHVFDILPSCFMLVVCLTTLNWNDALIGDHSRSLIVAVKFLIAFIIPFNLCIQLVGRNFINCTNSMVLNGTNLWWGTAMNLWWFGSIILTFITISVTDTFTVIPITGPLCVLFFLVGFTGLNWNLSIERKVVVSLVLWSTLLIPLMSQVVCISSVRRYYKNSLTDVSLCNDGSVLKRNYFTMPTFAMKEGCQHCLTLWSRSYGRNKSEMRLHDIAQYGPTEFKLPEDCESVLTTVSILKDILIIEMGRLKRLSQTVLYVLATVILFLVSLWKCDRTRQKLYLRYYYGKSVQRKQKEVLELLMPLYAVEMMLKSKKERHQLAVHRRFITADQNMEDLRVHYDPFTMMTERIEMCTVVFCEVMNFNSLVIELIPSDIVKILDGLFSAFDGMVDKWGVNKIETVFHTYLFAAWPSNNMNSTMWWCQDFEGDQRHYQPNDKLVNYIYELLSVCDLEDESVQPPPSVTLISTDLTDENISHLHEKRSDEQSCLHERNKLKEFIKLLRNPKFQNLLLMFPKILCTVQPTGRITTPHIKVFIDQFSKIAYLTESQLFTIRAFRCAVEMINYTQQLTACMRAPDYALTDKLAYRDIRLNIRIGMNSGPLVSGIVGRKKPQFALFGDTVNTAARMKSASKQNAINVSDKTHHLLELYSKVQHHVWHRNVKDLKGKGTMVCFLLDQKGLSSNG
eukprot:GHVH01002169.1.p1 GENE.GHVH01002169.1~~GHVH01002169.1.p1  ORF type:complete len:1100 (+),score=130.50 GHVH01002169.1:2503-5802(+)